MTSPVVVSIRESSVDRLRSLLAERVKMGYLPPAVDARADQPPCNHPLAVEFYVLTLVHQFGFWTLNRGRYGGPWHGMHEGRSLRGSSFVWARMLALLGRDPAAFCLDGAVDFSPRECEALRDDEGATPPLWEQHLHLSRQLRRHFASSGLAGVIADLGAAPERPRQFLGAFARLPVYQDDPHRKKLHLLYMYLTWRRDNPLGIRADAFAAPAVDYHMMRILLRFGAMEVHDARLASQLTARREVTATDAHLIRTVAVRIVTDLTTSVGVAAFVVDDFLFGLRTACDDSAAGPNCAVCPLVRHCEHRTHLFQPLVRSIVWY